MSISGGPNIIKNGLVLYLDAADDSSYVSGSTVWKDISGNNLTGSLINGVAYNTGSKGGMVFDGIDDHILVDSTSIIPGLTSFTLCLWLNYTIPSSDSMRDIINTRESSSPYKGFLLTTDYSSKNGKIRIQLNDTTSHEYISSSGTNIANGSNNLVCIVVNRTSNTATAYVNGNVDGTFNITGIGDITSTEKFYIGWDKAYNSSLAYFSGKIYSINVYNRALSADEILQNFNSTKGRYNL